MHTAWMKREREAFFAREECARAPDAPCFGELVLGLRPGWSGEYSDRKESYPRVFLSGSVLKTKL